MTDEEFENWMYGGLEFELKSCPFCGSIPELVYTLVPTYPEDPRRSTTNRWWAVVCYGCNGDTRTRWYVHDNHQNAVDDWNNRPTCAWVPTSFYDEEGIEGYTTSCGAEVPYRDWSEELPKFCEHCGYEVVKG